MCIQRIVIDLRCQAFSNSRKDVASNIYLFRYITFSLACSLFLSVRSELLANFMQDTFNETKSLSLAGL